MRKARSWVSEFAVIVLGVLLALAVDAAYGRRVDARVGRQYEARLASELQGAIDLLDEFDRALSRNLAAAVSARTFFYEGPESADEARLVVDLYNLGRDLPSRFDTSTYDDLVSTGRLELISEDETRGRILFAYKGLAELEQWLNPQREDYLRDVRGWIPSELVDQIRDTCPSIGAVEWACGDVPLDRRLVADVVGRLRTGEALRSFQLREQGVAYAITLVARSRDDVEAALATLVRADP